MPTGCVSNENLDANTQYRTFKQGAMINQRPPYKSIELASERRSDAACPEEPSRKGNGDTFRMY